MGRAGRDNAWGGGANHGCERHDGAAHGSARDHQGAPAVQGRAVGDQGGGHGCVSRTQALAALATIGFHPTEPLVSVTYKVRIMARGCSAMPSSTPRPVTPASPTPRSAT